jgi:membrane-bound lytic murein transglycosylase B
MSTNGRVRRGPHAFAARPPRDDHQHWGFGTPAGTLASNERRKPNHAREWKMRLTQRRRSQPKHVRGWKSRLTAPGRRNLTTAGATLVLVAAAMLAGRGDGLDPDAQTVSLESGAGVSVTDRALHAPDVPAISVGQAHVRDSKGTPKLPTSALAHLDIPETALLAYQRAADVINQVDDSCGLSWTLLAAIGRVESDHGRYGGAELRTDGTSSPQIRGVALDGRGPVAEIRDTDAGQLDKDAVWDRAVGPMQFLPSTWSVVGVDGDGDGVRSPNDIDDAALATAVFLCSAPGDLASPSGMETAVFRYNPSSSYVASVLAVERSYRAGEFDTADELPQADSAEIMATRAPDPATGLPSGSGPDGEGDATHAAHAIRAGSGPGQPGPDPSPTGSPGASPTTGTGTPDPSPTTGTPDPSPTTGTGTPDPGPVEMSGELSPTACGPDVWCLGGTPLDTGSDEELAETAWSDFDADRELETNAEELAGLAGAKVRVLAVPGTAPAVVVAIGDADYGPGH